MWRLLILALVLTWGAQPALAQEPGVESGFTFVQANCSPCHAIGPSGESPLSEAPPFRTLSKQYPLESLAESLAEGIVTGHPSMPEFQLETEQIDDVLAYLESIQE